MNIRIAVPRRIDAGHRDRLWRFCRPKWEPMPGATIVEGHHDDGPFNRAKAVNAAAEGDWDMIVVIDSDVVIPARQVVAAVELARTTGRAVLPYRRRLLLSKDGTRRIVEAGLARDWRRYAQVDPNKAHCSSVVVVPRALWDEVGGFDERFVGWGGEDDAFHAACMALAGVERVDGDVWHLWHPTSPERDWKAPLYLQCKALAERYVAAHDDPVEMRRILAEARAAGPASTLVAITTTGTRPDLLAKTVDSLTEALSVDSLGVVDRWLMCVDTADPGVVAELRSRYRMDVVHTGRGAGYAPAMAGAREAALRSGQPWVFWTEDDFHFDRGVDLVAMQQVMPQRCAQMTLMRQAWYEHERNAGGVVEANPEAFTRVEGEHPWLAHRAYWSHNPHLTRRATLTRDWPTGRDSERRYGTDLFADDPSALCGVWGDGTPWVTHLGEQQGGTRY